MSSEDEENSKINAGQIITRIFLGLLGLYVLKVIACIFIQVTCWKPWFMNNCNPEIFWPIPGSPR
jgi:hypothetical protein